MCVGHHLRYYTLIGGSQVYVICHSTIVQKLSLNSGFNKHPPNKLWKGAQQTQHAAKYSFKASVSHVQVWLQYLYTFIQSGNCLGQWIGLEKGPTEIVGTTGFVNQYKKNKKNQKLGVECILKSWKYCQQPSWTDTVQGSCGQEKSWKIHEISLSRPGKVMQFFRKWHNSWKSHWIIKRLCILLQMTVQRVFYGTIL